MREKSLQLATLPSIVALFVLMCVLCACGNSYNTLIIEYNSNFAPVVEEESLPHVGDENFDPSSMLQPFYWIEDRSLMTLCVTGPDGASSYQWSVKDKASDTAVDLGNTVLNARVISLYLPSAKNIKSGKAYSLILTVTDSAGTSYSDTATLYIQDNN